MAFPPNRSINAPRSRTFIQPPLYPVVVDTLIVGGGQPAREEESWLR